MSGTQHDMSLSHLLRRGVESTPDDGIRVSFVLLPAASVVDRAHKHLPNILVHHFKLTLVGHSGAAFEMTGVVIKVALCEFKIR